MSLAPGDIKVNPCDEVIFYIGYYMILVDGDVTPMFEHAYMGPVAIILARRPECNGTVYIMTTKGLHWHGENILQREFTA